MTSDRAYVVNLLMKLIRSTHCFRLKRILLARARATSGLAVRYFSESAFLTQDKLKIGDLTWLAHGALFIRGDVETSISSNFNVAPSVCSISDYEGVSYYGPRVAKDGFSLPIYIENGCWIGTGSIILQDLHVEKIPVVIGNALTKLNSFKRCAIRGSHARKLKKLDFCDPLR